MGRGQVDTWENVLASQIYLYIQPLSKHFFQIKKK